jgi:serine phosphatase RsbU (regulator of sigma subunit)
VKLQKGDCVYTFTDGYADQFGGPKGKKYKYKQFEELLMSIWQKPMREQHQLLNDSVENWRGDLEQNDDICVIGVRI